MSVPERITEACLCEARCVLCDKRWTAFLPDGVEHTKTLECPACHAASGMVVDEQGNPL